MVLVHIFFISIRLRNAGGKTAGLVMLTSSQVSVDWSCFGRVGKKSQMFMVP